MIDLLIKVVCNTLQSESNLNFKIFKKDLPSLKKLYKTKNLIDKKNYLSVRFFFSKLFFSLLSVISQ